MLTSVRAVAAVLVLTLVGVAFGQVESDEPVKFIRISGRIVNPDGAPIPNQIVRQSTVGGQPEVSSVKTDQKGMFTFSAETHVLYEVNLSVSEAPPVFKGIGSIEAVDGESMELGNVVVQFSPKHQAMIHVLGPVRMRGLADATNPAAPSSNAETRVAAVYTLCSDSSPEFCAHLSLHVILGNATEIQPPNEKDQVGFSSPMISPDDRAVGWLADFDFCCTSYPTDLALVIYRPGKPIRRFTGDGRAIFRWRFFAGSEQVGFYQDFLHGTSAQHYELRDVETERLIEKWDGDLTPVAPSWVRELAQ